MGSKGHLTCSMAKSLIRIGGAIYAISHKDLVGGFFAFGIAEVLGIVEELVDQR